MIGGGAPPRPSVVTVATGVRLTRTARLDTSAWVLALTGGAWTLTSVLTTDGEGIILVTPLHLIYRFSGPILAYCGQNTTCTNNHGSYTCPCNTGYENFQANIGCSDLNECTHSSWNRWIG